ncbi:cyclopropane-fatty-acyl-phospholipid synthase family protein [Streptomyces sp. ISL-100]|uniref:SAM-dependent methyltransferase n=1 Tax=Streptomyces sp. ISL-100 TaxID=2819173 RepID=UPI001BE542D5|nr:class I SAM-dependent methyltransferase [Streptomyces sp. ISL-100]MBT2399860.1 methyltransferase domain-containing protein [Streptomyces sp. ISL-100]
MTSGSGVSAEGLSQQEAEDGFYNDTSEFLAELSGGSLHMGYWESPSDPATMAEASRRLTGLMAERIKISPGDRVLDIGCGTGAPAIQLAQATGAVVVGITNSPAQVRLAAEKAREAQVADRVSFRCADAGNLDFAPESFDAVWLFESIMAMPDRLAVLRQAAAVLRPGGRLALTDFLDRAASSGGAQQADAPQYAVLMGKLMPLQDYPLLLEEAGLTPVEISDVSDRTVARTMDCMRQRLADDRESLTRRFGAQVVGQFDNIVQRLEAAGFGYGIVVADRPGQ